METICMEPIKKRITRYWSQRAEAFAQQRIREFSDEKSERWMDEFKRYIPGDRPLKVLDIGTGTGYFAFLFASMGHDAVGIDLTEDMIKGAMKTAGILNLRAQFLMMDAEKPDFHAESFDVLVTRNLTWTLPHLDHAYNEWFRILKRGGVLINFDADYCRAVEESQVPSLPDHHAHNRISREMWKENEHITMELSAYQQPRPQWDVQLLAEAGFERICVDFGVYRRVYAKVDEFYNPTPIFTLAAYKD